MKVKKFSTIFVILNKQEKQLLTEFQVYKVNEFEQIKQQVTNNKKYDYRLSIPDLKSIPSVIKDFDFFVAEKWKIAGDKQGSGNTANIGCSLAIHDLHNENGVFSKLGENWFDEYWINFGTLTTLKNGKTLKITNIESFLEFKGRPDLIKKVVK